MRSGIGPYLKERNWPCVLSNEGCAHGSIASRCDAINVLDDEGRRGGVLSGDG